MNDIAFRMMLAWNKVHGWEPIGELFGYLRWINRRRRMVDRFPARRGYVLKWRGKRQSFRKRMGAARGWFAILSRTEVEKGFAHGTRPIRPLPDGRVLVWMGESLRQSYEPDVSRRQQRQR